MNGAEADEGDVEPRRAAIDDLVEGLRSMRIQAGKPPFRAMAKASGTVSHTTLHDALSGTRMPTWPTVEAFVRACGGDVDQWRRRWAQAAGQDPSVPSGAPNSLAIPGRQADEADCALSVGRSGCACHPATRSAPTASRRHLRPAVWAAAFGIVVGAGVGLGVEHLAGTVHPAAQACPVTDAAAPNRPALSSAVDWRRPATTPSGGAEPAWVGRPASDAQILSGTSVVLPVTARVVGGDALIVTLMLTSTCPGAVSVTDNQGDRFSSVADETDTSQHRTMIFAAFDVRPLSTADSIRVTYPSASKYHIAVDEFRGVSTVVGESRAHGESGGTAFSTSSDHLDCAPGELLVTAVGSNTGTAPVMSPGWTTLPVLKLSSYRLTTAYQVVHAYGPCAATGTTTAQWGALLAAFR